MYIVIAILANLLVLVGTKWVQQTGNQYCADIAAANGVSLSDFLAWNNIKVSIATDEISFFESPHLNTPNRPTVPT